MATFNYHPLDQEAPEHLGESKRHWDGRAASMPGRKKIYFLIGLLVVLSISNVILLVKSLQAGAIPDAQSYAGLQRNVPTTILHDDRNLDDEMWDAPEFDTYTGWVALSDKFTEDKGLLHAMRFPWDSTKGIYFLHGYHSMHCVLVLRQSLREFRDNQTQTWAFGHVTHCLHTLREDTICNADDFPRYTGALHASASESKYFSGIGAVRMCRDWKKLHKFAIENSACYRRPVDRYMPLLDRYKFCPDGSRPWEEQF